MVGDFLHYEERSCMERETKNKHQSLVLFSKNLKTLTDLHLTLSVFIILRVFWEVLQIICGRTQKFKYFTFNMKPAVYPLLLVLSLLSHSCLQ